MTEQSWSLGTLIWLPSAALLILLCLGLAFACLVWWRNERKSNSHLAEPGLALLTCSSFVACALLVVGGTAWGMYPYEAEYHQWRTESGTVAAIDSRLLSGSDGNGPTERFVITFDDDRQRSCDDTRCAQVEVGDVVSLSCKREWQYTGTDGYACNFVGRTR